MICLQLSLIIIHVKYQTSYTYQSCPIALLMIKLIQMYLLCLRVCCKWRSTTCLHSYIPIYSKLMLLNNFTIHVAHWITPYSTYLFRVKTGNNVSEFIHSKCIMLSYYSSPKHKRVCFLDIWYTSVHINLEHGLAILTESFSPLRSILHNLPCWNPKQKCVTSHAIPF